MKIKVISKCIFYFSTFRLYLCENPVLSVVLLQDVLEGELDLLLELLHLHLLLEPGSICRGNCDVSLTFVTFTATFKVFRGCFQT